MARPKVFVPRLPYDHFVIESNRWYIAFQSIISCVKFPIGLNDSVSSPVGIVRHAGYNDTGGKQRGYHPNCIGLHARPAED